MNLTQRIAGFILAIILFITSTAGVYAETDQDKLNQQQQQLQQSNDGMEQKIQQRKQVEQQIQETQKDIEKGDQAIAEKDKEIALLQGNIEQTKQQIEKKKEEIVVLENKVSNRKEVMRNRVVSMQSNDNSSLLVEILINSENLADLLEKMNAVVTILDADKNILKMQQKDLETIEKDKQIVDQKERLQEAEMEKMKKNQAERAAQQQKKQEAVATLQAKYTELSNLITLNDEQKKTIEANIKGLQEAIAREQEAKKAAANPQPAITQPNEKPPVNGQVMYMEATSYSVEGSIKNGEARSAYGIDMTANPNIKMIAVDSKIIPLGKRVWVEGYGEAIAGDTGRDIQNHRIDVLYPTEAESKQWGRKIVKVIILN